MKLSKMFRRSSRSLHAATDPYSSIYAPSLITGGKERLVLLECWGGKKIDDSPLAIAETFAKLAPDWDIRFSTNRPISSEFAQVQKHSADYWAACAKASIIIDNNALNPALHKHPEQLILQTWHGAPIKKIGYDIEEIKFASKNYKTKLHSETVLWDALLSPSRYVTDIFRNAFGFMGEVLEFGLPRNDVLFREASNSAKIMALRDKLGVPRDAKVVLYAPTWRDDQMIKPGLYGFDDALDIGSLSSEFPDLWFLYRGHHLQQNPYDAQKIANFIDVSQSDPVSDLYLVADVLISDYSSVMIDYSLLKRPIIRYVPDLDRYKNSTRGFYCDFENDLPMPLCKNHASLVTELHTAVSQPLPDSDKWETWRKNYVEFEDGEAARKTTEWLLAQFGK